jgi:hypothetical protein
MKQRLILQATATLIAASSTAFSTVLADPIDMPNRKPGLWEIKMVSADARMPPQTILQCTDANTDADMRTTFSPMVKDMCSQQDMKKTATGYSIDATCNFRGIASTSHTDISGDFNSAYTVKVSTSQSGAPANAPHAHEMTMNATWMGPCKGGQRAGDIVMPGGIKINVSDMKAMRTMMPKHIPSAPPH